MAAEKFYVPGFKAGAIKASIRYGSDTRMDMALAVSDRVAHAAGVFTRNKVKAAPVELARKRIGRGRARAILVNAGIANAMTGDEGTKAAVATTAAVAETLGVPAGQVLPASTGVIGVQLPVETMVRAVPKLTDRIKPGGFDDFSKAILTTDTAPKVATAKFSLGSKKASMIGIAKGSGMIAPDMATMLAFVFTDVAVSPKFLKSALKIAADSTFNRITIDGDTSTNDSLFILANGALGNTAIEAGRANAKKFADALLDVCSRVARMIVVDGEGATRVAKISVVGAASDADALKVARTVAESPLVKTALCGADPNWGRIAAAAGRSGAKVDPKKLSVKIGTTLCVKGGVPVESFDEKKAKAAMNKKTVDIEIDLGTGKGTASFLTCDMTKGYIEINAHYRT